MDRSLTVIRQPTLDDTLRTCKHLAASGYFKDVREISQAVAKVLAGQELGFAPLASLTGIHLIEGKITLSANLIATLVKRHPDYDYSIKSLDNEQCTIVFLERGEMIGESAFTIEDATRAGLIKPRSAWGKHPRNMLFARAISNGVKWFCPQLTSGAPVYTPGELGEDVDEDGRIVEAVVIPNKILKARQAVKDTFIVEAKKVRLLSERPTDLEFAELKHILGPVYEELLTATEGLDELCKAGVAIITEHAPKPEPETVEEDTDALDDDADLSPAE